MIELSWNMSTGDVDVLQNRSLIGVVRNVEKLEVHKHGEVILTHARGTVTIYDVQAIRYIGEEGSSNGDETE